MASVLVFLAVLWTTLAICAAVTATRPFFVLFLAAYAMLCIVAAGFILHACIHRATSYHPFPHRKFVWPSMNWGQTLLLSAVVLDAVFLSVRLFAFDHFDGNPADLNFGLKPHKPSQSPRALNQSFGSWKSAGHAVQGSMAIFLFPIWINLLRTFQPKPIFGQLLSTLPILLVAYPIYNLIKRAAKSHDKFAISSFPNNEAEWACGAMLGICIGLCATAICSTTREEECDESESGSNESAPKLIEKTIKVAVVVAGVLLHVTLAVAIGFSAATWNVLH